MPVVVLQVSLGWSSVGQKTEQNVTNVGKDLLGRRWGRGEKDIREVEARAIRMHYVCVWS